MSVENLPLAGALPPLLEDLFPELLVVQDELRDDHCAAIVVEIEGAADGIAHDLGAGLPGSAAESSRLRRGHYGEGLLDAFKSRRSRRGALRLGGEAEKHRSSNRHDRRGHLDHWYLQLYFLIFRRG